MDNPKEEFLQKIEKANNETNYQNNDFKNNSSDNNITLNMNEYKFYFYEMKIKFNGKSERRIFTKNIFRK